MTVARYLLLGPRGSARLSGTPPKPREGLLGEGKGIDDFSHVAWFVDFFKHPRLYP
jgi:hypothetical protein